MSDTAPTPPPAPDYATVRKTVEFLSRHMRVKQFALKKAVRLRKEAESHETQTRKDLQRITRRIQREIDLFPAAFRGFIVRDDWED